MIQGPKGTKDVLPGEAYKWHTIEEIFRDRAHAYGYREIRTPVFEHTELFLRGVGETTDVVQKEMYTFLDKGERSITLKPEGTAGAARAFLEHGLFNQPLPLKMYYFTPVFRYERPQSGRLREHHQFGIEVFGGKDAALDAEIIALGSELLQTLSLPGISLRINSIGCPACRKSYHNALREYYMPHKKEICETCQTRLEVNPMRLLDCKVPADHALAAGAPAITDYLCEDCQTHFHALQSFLGAYKIDFTVDSRIVRGLDYYTRTVFEFVYAMPDGSELTVCGGGRYDNLANEIGGQDIPGAGFGLGLERLLMVMENSGIEVEKPREPEVFIACIGEKAKLFAVPLLARLRGLGVLAEMDYAGRSIKAQFKFAGKSGFHTVVTIGDNEIENNAYRVKDMASGQEVTLTLEMLPVFLAGRSTQV